LNRTLRWLLPAALAIGALALLFYNTRQADVARHDRIVGEFRELRSRYDDIERDVLMADSGRLGHYDDLVSNLGRVKALGRGLRSSADGVYKAGHSEYDRLADALDMDLARLEVMIEDFKSENAELRNSLHYLPIVFDRLMAATTAHPVLTDLFLDLQHLLFSAAAGIENPDHENGLALVLSQLDTRSNDPAGIGADIATDIKLLLAHTRIVITNTRLVDGYIADLTALPIAARIDDLAASYDRVFAAAQPRAALFRVGLIAFAGTLLALLIWTLSRLETALAAQRHTLAQLEFQKFALDQHAIVSIADARGRITYANERFCAISQYSREELLGQDHRIVNSGQHPRGFFAEMWQTMARGQVWQGEVCNRRKDGDVYWVRSTIVPFLDEGGRPWQYISIRTDITALKAAEAALRESEAAQRRQAEELRLARDQAVEASRLKSEFLSTMSHEIRTPMNGVIGMTDLLRETSLDAEQRQFVDTIHDSAHALLTIINDILDFSKIEAIDFPPLAVVESSLELLAAKAHEKGLAVMTYIDPAIPPTLRGDPGRLRQILLNLTGNAIKFTSAGEVMIRALSLRHDDATHTVRFEVTDTGIGMDLAVQRRLFQPFTQADGSVTRRFGGTGLGLSICKRLVELMGGRIGVESEEGRGSTFWFEIDFPCEAGAGTAEAAPLQDTTVLLIGGTPGVSDAIHRYLDAWNARVERPRVGESISGDYGLAVIIADHDADLTALRDTVTAGRPELPCLLVAADDDQRQAALHTGYVAAVTQPLRRTVLRDSVLQVLGRMPRPAPEVPAPDAVSAPTRADGERRTLILLAEDNAVNQIVAVKHLDRLGYGVAVTSNGEEAVLASASLPCTLILMDCQMPVMDGFEATRAIRRREQTTGEHLPIVAMTANAMQGDRERCLEAGMDDHLSKPINPAQLQATIERWLQLTSDVAPATVATEAPAFDFSNLRDLFGGDENAVRQLLELFLATTGPLLDKLRHAQAGGDLKTVRAVAHQIAGSAANIGLDELRAAARNLERAAVDNDADSLSALIEEASSAFASTQSGIRAVLGA